MPRRGGAKVALGEEGELTLLDVPRPEPLEQPKGAKAKAKKARPRYAKYYAKDRLRCDHCVLVTHEKWPAPAPPIRQARVKRRAGEEETLLCYEHAKLQVAIDGATLPADLMKEMSVKGK